MSSRVIPSIGVLAVACMLVFGPATASAEDKFPCDVQTKVAWSKSPVQSCPLGAPTGPNGSIPVYPMAIGVPKGRAVPTPIGWLRGSSKLFVCQRYAPKAVFYHPGGWYNHWWAYTRSDEGKMGWVPEVYFKGGINDEPDAKLAITRPCPPPPPPTSNPPKPTPPPVSPCEPTPLVDALQLDALFSNRKRKLTARFGRDLTVSGALQGADGSPIAGAQLCVGTQGSENDPVEEVDAVTTDASGRFTYTLKNPVSERLWFVHRIGTGAAATSVVARVRAPVRLRASRRSLRNGQSVLLSGRLDADVPARGLLVEIQAARGRKWQTFKTLHTGRGGKFRYRYRFTRTLGVQNYRLRALIPGQGGSQFAAGASRPVRVRVSGG